jgi:hypothetical protein
VCVEITSSLKRFPTFWTLEVPRFLMSELMFV